MKKLNQLPKGYVEVWSTCSKCEMRFAAFVKLGGEPPINCEECHKKGK